MRGKMSIAQMDKHIECIVNLGCSVEKFHHDKKTKLLNNDNQVLFDPL